MSLASTIPAMLTRNGRAMTLRRRVGTTTAFTEASVTGYASAYYWESKDLYLKLGGGSGWDICLIEPVTRRAWFVVTDFPRPWTGAWAWVEEHQVAVWYGTGRDVYILRPPADPIGTPWTWELYTLPDGPDPLAEVPVATAHPYFNRLIYWPHLARFSWCATGSGNVQLFSVPL